VSAVDSNGRTIWIADAHRDDVKRFVVRADEKLTVFWNLKRRFGHQARSYIMSSLIFPASAGEDRKLFHGGPEAERGPLLNMTSQLVACVATGQVLLCRS